jgi:hypothetical protein
LEFCGSISFLVDSCLVRYLCRQRSLYSSTQSVHVRNLKSTRDDFLTHCDRMYSA